MNRFPHLKIRCFIALLIIIPSAASVYAQPAQKEDETLRLLKDFAAKAPTMKDNDALAAIKELSKKIPDDRLPIVEEFGLTDDAKDFRFGFVYLLVERNRFDSAARLIVKRMAETEQDHEYIMWKWWEGNFGERENYKELSHQIGDALLRQFDNGDEKTKLIVAEIFGKGKTEATMNLSEFKKAIGYKDDN